MKKPVTRILAVALLSALCVCAFAEENVLKVFHQNISIDLYIAVLDLTKMSDLIRGRTYEPFFPLIATAFIYYLIIWLVTWLLRKAFQALNSRNRKDAHILKGASENSRGNGV